MAPPAAVSNQRPLLQESPNAHAPSVNPARARIRPEAARLAELLRGEGELGSAFAAFLCFRADLLSPEFLDALRTVRETAPPLDPGRRAAALLQALGQAGAALLENFEPEPLWSNVSRCAFRSRWQDKTVVVQFALPPLADSAFDAFDRWAVQNCGLLAPKAVERPVLAQFRQWIRLADDPGRERSYLEAAAGLAGQIATVYPVPIPEISGARVLSWEWVDGEPLESLFESGDAEAASRLAELVLEQICVLSFLDAGLDTASIVSAGGRLVVRQANRLAAIPPPQVRTALRYVSAVLAANSPVAVRALLRLAWGRTAVEHESKMLDELSGLGPELKGGRRFSPSGNMIESNWRALSKVNGERPLYLDAMHRALITVAYRNSETCPGSDAIIDAHWPVAGRLLQLRVAGLMDRQTLSQWIVGSGLLMVESFRQVNRLADEFRDNEVAIGVDQPPREEAHDRAANRSVGVWILIGVFFVMFMISLHWAAVLPPPYSAAGTVLAIAGAIGLFRTVSKVG